MANQSRITNETISEGIRNIGKRIAMVRKQTQKSQKEFATLMGISSTTQSNYETGNASPPISYFLELEQLGFDSDFVLLNRPKQKALSEIQISEIEDLLDEIPSILKMQRISIDEPGAIKTALKMLNQEKHKAVENGIPLKDYLIYKFEIDKRTSQEADLPNLRLALKTERLLHTEKKKDRR